MGDTITLARPHGRQKPLPGFKEIKPQVFAGLYPGRSPTTTTQLRDALEKLKLNDASLQYEPEVSQALGFGFRCGFLGLLHMEIVQERLEREFDLDLITTAPTVVYEVVLNATAASSRSKTPSKLPDLGKIEEMREPIVTCHHLGAAGLRGHRDHPVQPEARRAAQHALPRPPGAADLRDADERSGAGLLRQAEVRLAVAMPPWTTSFKEYRACRPGQAGHADQRREGRCPVHHRAPGQRASTGAAQLADKMRELIPRQMFDVAIQAAIGAQHHRPRDRQGPAQERAGQVLRR